MGQLGPRSMLPPGQQGMNPGQMAPTPYPNMGGRPPSRTATPQSGGMMNPSPSLAPRQPPGMMPGADPRQDMNAIINEYPSIPPQMLPSLKAEAGLGDKALQHLTQQEKVRPI